jgi:hypothetical protein
MQLGQPCGRCRQRPHRGRCADYEPDRFGTCLAYVPPDTVDRTKRYVVLRPRARFRRKG